MNSDNYGYFVHNVKNKQTKKERIKELKAELLKAHSHDAPPVIFVYEERIKELQQKINDLITENISLRDELEKLRDGYRSYMFLVNYEKNRSIKKESNENYQS
jgi:hypothetical protein